jgi:predicted Zn-ribbon and HTH transcriptional regulator
MAGFLEEISSAAICFVTDPIEAILKSPNVQTCHCCSEAWNKTSQRQIYTKLQHASRSRASSTYDLRVRTTAADQQPKGLVFIPEVNPSRCLVEHMFKPMFLRFVRTQDVVLWNPSGRGTSWTYIVLSTDDHLDSKAHTG